MDINSVSQVRHRHTAAERLQVVEQFRRSGLSRTEFSQQFGIPVSTLDAWRVKCKRDSHLPAPAVFNEVRLAAAPVIAPRIRGLTTLIYCSYLISRI
jgi:transposase-like protein